MLKNILNLSFGTILSQVIIFIFSFIMARIYDDRSFGEYSVFLGVVALVAIISVSSYDKAIMFATSQRRLRALVALILLLTTTVILVSALLLFIAGMLSPEQLGKLGNGVYWVPVGVAVAALYQVFQFTHLRIGAVQTLSLTKVAQSSVTGGVQFLLAAAILVPGLIVGHLVGQALSAIVLVFLLTKTGFRFSDLRPTRILGTAKKFQAYPRYTLPNELIDSASTQIQTILIGALYGLGTLGQFAFGLRILSAPAALVGQAVGQSFFHAIRGADQTHASILAAMYRIWMVLAALAVIPFTLLMFFGSEIFAFLFGSSWAYAGEIAQYSSPLLLARFISSPTSTIYLKLGLQKQQLWFPVAALFYRITPLFLYLVKTDFLSVLIVISIFEIVGIIVYNWYAVRVLRSGKLLERPASAS